MMTEKEYSPKVLVDTADLSEAEWLEWRRKGIGGSDAAAVLGISPFGTARDLYYDKLNIATLDGSEENWVQKQIGHLLEDLVAEIFQKKTGFQIYQMKKMFCHPQHPFMLADIDYFVVLPSGEIALLEIKTTNYNAKDHWWKDGKEVVPINYEAQGRHYMCVTNLNHVFYCCLYGNSEEEVIIRHIERDLAYEAEMIAVESEFWNEYVLKKTPPPYTEDGALVLDSVNRYFGADTNAPAIELNVPLAGCVLRFTELQAQKKEIDAQSKKLENEMKRLQGQIVAEMGASCSAVCSAGGEDYAITYNPTIRPMIGKDALMRLQMQHPEIYQEYVTVSESRRFYVRKSQKAAA